MLCKSYEKVELGFRQTLLRLEDPLFPSGVLFLLEAVSLLGELFPSREVLRRQYHLNQNPSFLEEAFLYWVDLQVYWVDLQACLVDLQVLQAYLAVPLPYFVVVADLLVCWVGHQAYSVDLLVCLVDHQACLEVLRPCFVVVASWVHRRHPPLIQL